MAFQIQIDDNVEIPKREVNFGPRGSQYPLADMKSGQSFALKIVGKTGQKKQDGTELTQEQDAERKARQKQSYFSQLGKRLNIDIVTRYSKENGELRVWHNGPRAADADNSLTEEEAAAAAEEEAEAAEMAGQNASGDFSLDDE